MSSNTTIELISRDMRKASKGIQEEFEPLSNDTNEEEMKMFGTFHPEQQQRQLQQDDDSNSSFLHLSNDVNRSSSNSYDGIESNVHLLHSSLPLVRNRSTWSLIAHFVTTCVFGTKDSALSSPLIPKYFRKGKFMEQILLRAHKSIPNQQIRACVAFLNLLFIFLFVFCVVDTIYIAIRFKAVGLSSIAYICLSALFYLLLKTRWFHFFRFFSIITFTVIPYILISMEEIYGPKLSKHGLFLILPLSRTHVLTGNELSSQTCLTFVSLGHIILFPVMLSIITSSPFLVLLIFLINFMLVVIQPIWLQFFISIDYLDYISDECIFALPLVLMLLIISYMHCVVIMQIQDGENRYKNILKLATESIIIYDNNHGFIIDINPSFQNCFGYTLDECKELIIEDLLTFKKRDMHGHLDSSHEDIDYSTSQRREVLKTGTWTKCIGVTKNGTNFPAEVIFKQCDYNGRNVDVFVIRDLRDRKEMKKHYKEAEHARVELQRRTNFFAMVSHDLKTPLNSIYLIAQKLLERCDAKDVELVNMIVDSCQILSNIIKDVLFSTRLDAGSLSLDISRFNLRKSIEKIVCISGITALRKGLDIAVEFDTHITSLKIPQYVYGDPGKFQQILTNLLGNAIKFTRTGSIIVRIEVKELTSNSIKVYISVKDTGIGIPQDKQPLLFQMFARVHEDKKIEGTGLGLAICKNLCKLMKGDIGFQSNIGEGSEFWFTAVFNTQNPRRSPSSDNKLLSTNEVETSVPHHKEYVFRHRSAIPTIEISDLPLTFESSDDEGTSLKDNGTENDEDSSSLLSEDTAYYILNNFYSIDIKKIAALIIYKNEQVRVSLQQYFENFGIRTICVTQCDSFFLNKETVTSQLNLTLYNASIPSRNRNEWATIIPIALVIIDDDLLLNPEMDLGARRASVINLFETNVPLPPLNKKKNSISDTGRKINVKDMERIFKVVNRLKFLISRHNILCNGEPIDEDLVYYCCLYHTFDIERMKEFCANLSSGNTLDGNFDNNFLHGYVRKPLRLTAVIKILDGMVERYEQFNKRYTDQMGNFKQNKSKQVNQEEQFNSDITTQLSNYQFPPSKNNAVVRVSSANCSSEKPPKASYMKQRRSESSFIPKYQMNPISFRKYSDSSVQLHESSIRTEDEIKEIYAKLYPVEDGGTLLESFALDKKQYSDNPNTTINEVVSPHTNVLESMQPEGNDFRNMIINTLVADDNDINRKIMVRILQDCSLRRNNYNTSSIMKQYSLDSVQVDCISVSDGQDVIDDFKYRISNSKDIVLGPILDLIFLDIHMKGVNGIKCARNIRKLERENHIINSAIIVGITGDTQIEKQCLAAGMNRVILKPFKQEQLCELIEEAIQRKSKGINL